MINKYLQGFVLSVTIAATACTPSKEVSLPSRLEPLTAEQYPSPPPESYFRVNHATVSPKWMEPVNVSHAELSLHEAIHATLPFSVAVYPKDVHVDLEQSFRIRTGKEMRVVDFLTYLEGITNYKITLNPHHDTVEISSYISQQWNLATIASASLNKIDFGSSEDDEQTGSNLVVSSRLDYGEQTPWNLLVRQAHCIMRTAACVADDRDEDDEDETIYDTQASDTTWIQADQRTGLLIASGTVQAIARLDAWLTPLAQKSQRLVQMEVMILDVANHDIKTKLLNLLAVSGSERIGWLGGAEADRALNSGGWIIDSDFSISGNHFDVLLNHFNRKQDLQVLHRTSLIATNGGAAHINSVETFSYADGQEIIPGDINNQEHISVGLEQAQVGLELTIMPQFLADDQILLTVVPALSSLLSFDNIVSSNQVISRAPRISLTNLSSKAITRSGRAVAVGGLSTKQMNDRAHTAWGLDQTLLGDLLTNKNQHDQLREIVVVVLPREISA